MNGCPKRDELVSFCSGELSSERFDAVADHLECCRACEAVVVEMESAGVALVAPLRELPTAAGFLAEAEWKHVSERLQATPEPLSGFETRSVARTQDRSSTLRIEAPPLGDYRLLQVVGQGGMGTVYKARHTRLNKLVAVKLLPEDRVRDAQSVARFQREMRAIGQLQHPNIVAAYDAGDADGRPFLVMEFVEGLNLATVLRRLGPLPFAAACELARQIAAGLDYAHRHGLVHRDIKPSNLMLTTEGQVKILDLGLARLHGDFMGELTDDNQVMGSTDYMAPEQADGSRAVDGRADLYSLGCTIYKLLAGEAPFSGDRYHTPAQKLMAHLHAPPPPICHTRPDVPADVTGIVERLLAKSPSARYSTAAELAAALVPLAASSDLVALYRSAAETAEPNQAADDLWSPGRETMDSRAARYSTPREIIERPIAGNIEETISQDAAMAMPAASGNVARSGLRRPKGQMLIRTGVAASLLLAAVVIIKMRDGKRVSVEVSGDVEQVTVREGAAAAANAVDIVFDDAALTDRDRAVAEWVLAVGGWVNVVVKEHIDHITAPKDLPVEKFRVHYVWLRDIDDITDDDLKRLEGLSQIRNLDLWGTRIGDAGVAHLAGLKSLGTLNLRMTRITDAGLKSLAALTNLDGLDIVYDAFDDAGLENIAMLKKLKHLQAFTTGKVGDKGLLHLRGLTGLEHVSINAADATDAGLAFVDNLDKLEVLDLLDTPVGDAGLKHIVKATRLKWLRIGDAGITLEGWRTLLPLARLKSLNVRGREIGDRLLEGVAQIQQLEELTVTGFAGGDDGLKHLGQMANLRRIVLDPSENVTDAGLIHLEGLRQLSELSLPGAKITSTGIGRLKKTLPTCKLSL